TRDRRAGQPAPAGAADQSPRVRGRRDGGCRVRRCAEGATGARAHGGRREAYDRDVPRAAWLGAGGYAGARSGGGGAALRNPAGTVWRGAWGKGGGPGA